jgi:hypothetical protein
MSDPVYEDTDYGPLACLLGVWKGNAGEDIAPEPDGDEINPYFETLTFEAAGDVTNAEEQVLAVVNYRQVVSRISTGKVFHDQVGYWLWEAATGLIMQTLTIPRGVMLLAGGRAVISNDSTTLSVEAKEGSTEWGIIQSPFMQEKARTLEFRHDLTVKGSTLSYNETTVLKIYGIPRYPHTDQNTLQRQQG